MKEEENQINIPNFEFKIGTNTNECGSLAFISLYFVLKFRSLEIQNKSKKRLKKILTFLIGLQNHKKRFQKIFSLLNCFSGSSMVLQRFVYFVHEQETSISNLFVFLEIERMLIQFFMSQIEFVCYELSTKNLIKFLKEFKAFIGYYYDKGSYFEYLQRDASTGEFKEETFIEEYLDKTKFAQINQKYETWIFLLEISMKLSRIFFY